METDGGNNDENNKPAKEVDDKDASKPQSSIIQVEMVKKGLLTDEAETWMHKAEREINTYCSMISEEGLSENKLAKLIKNTAAGLRYGQRGVC